MILATIGATITQARAEYEAKYARRKTPEEIAETGVAQFESVQAVEVAAGDDPSTPESSPA